MAQIISRLSDPDCRLLTLVGPGGAGKTRLALQAAQEIVDARIEKPTPNDLHLYIHARIGDPAATEASTPGRWVRVRLDVEAAG